MKKSRDYRIAASFDTETTNYGEGDQTRAFASVYMFNDLRNVDLRYYKPDESPENVTFLRYQPQAIEYIEELILWGNCESITPIICAYNLMFDLQTLIKSLNELYDMETNAQSSTNVYTLDLLDDDGVRVLRFWDTYHLEMRGLAAMGETCGIAKANGDWDYSLIRTPETPLTEDEIFYAKRDVQVIPAYLRYLLEANEWMKPSDLGNRILTKTSIVRQMAQRRVGAKKFKNSKGHRISLLKSFESTCMQQMPKTYEQYALRKSAFRGGFTFTAANTASMVVENVASLDVTSMHHTFINGRYIPIDFRKKPLDALNEEVIHVLNKTTEEVLSNYHKPFLFAFHARIKFKNIRLRNGSCFEKWGVALIPEGKFKAMPAALSEIGIDERAKIAELHTRAAGWHDRATNPMFAFGKLMKADECILHLSELELWCVSRVYEWDDLEVLFGEGTRKYRRPPDYVTLQSNLLFETKTHAKIINKNYVEGTPYKLEIPDTIPDGIAKALSTGKCKSKFFEAYYNSTVKGMFNGIYGTMAQDIFKPSYAVEDGELYIDSNTVIDKATWEELQPNKCKVLYTYGLRIVGGSRMHLVVAMELLHACLGDKVCVTGGDTDSLKVSCDESITDEMLMKALNPIYEASRLAIDRTMRQVRKDYPEWASELSGIGGFDIESCGNGTRYEKHMEAWNKARISLTNGSCHITCAGLSRPIGAYHIETWFDDMLRKGLTFDELAPLVLGYNVSISHDICHALQKHKPNANDVFDENVTDYLGNTCRVTAPEAISLYNASRELGEITKQSNYECVAYLQYIGREVDTRIKSVEIQNGVPVLKIIGGDGIETM